AVLAGWLRALGVHPSGLPAGPGEAAALFRSLTAQNPVAILADDAASAEQARAILPGAGLVIITSRHQLADLVALDGARFISLGPLGPAAAAELAARVAGRDAPAAAFTELADCCGNLPLAIRATAALLAVRPQLGMEQVVADLTARRQGLPASGTSQEGIVTAAMHASYDRLDREAARTYRLLSLHPGPDFTAAAAAALLDADADQAGHLISVLAGASLLEEALPGRWRYHDLSRAHARQTAAATDGEDERAAAVARAIDYYLRASAAADLLILPGRRRIAEAFSLPARDQPAHASTADAVAWLDAEQANLLHAQKTAADQARHATAWQFCDTMWGWCRSRHDYPAWKQVCEQAVASAKACSDPRAEVHAATRLASCLIAMGEAAAAAPVAEEAVATAWANGDRAGEGSAREHAGICALERGDYQAAISHCNRGLDCWRRVSQHERAEAILHRLLGRAYAALGDHRQAHAHLNTALGIFTRLGEDYHAARARYILAITRLAAAPGGEHAGEAIDLLQQARPVMEAEDQPLPLSELLTALAEAHARTGNTSVAQACLEEASALHQGLRLPASHPARARARAIAGQLATPHSPQAHHAQAHDSHEPPEPGG
ncbi:MAG: tetratricopeptide repeat protein, partial [Nocardiopsaceae bacterium]|nr:tetratricopeptide repeat protein [Nocardiopsaceae bacterium]